MIDKSVIYNEGIVTKKYAYIFHIRVDAYMCMYTTLAVPIVLTVNGEQFVCEISLSRIEKLSGVLNKVKATWILQRSWNI